MVISNIVEDVTIKAEPVYNFAANIFLSYKVNVRNPPNYN